MRLSGSWTFGRRVSALLGSSTARGRRRCTRRRQRAISRFAVPVGVNLHALHPRREGGLDDRTPGVSETERQEILVEGLDERLYLPGEHHALVERFVSLVARSLLFDLHGRGLASLRSTRRF